MGGECSAGGHGARGAAKSTSSGAGRLPAGAGQLVLTCRPRGLPCTARPRCNRRRAGSSHPPSRRALPCTRSHRCHRHRERLRRRRARKSPPRRRSAAIASWSQLQPSPPRSAHANDSSRTAPRATSPRTAYLAVRVDLCSSGSPCPCQTTHGCLARNPCMIAALGAIFPHRAGRTASFRRPGSSPATICIHPSFR